MLLGYDYSYLATNENQANADPFTFDKSEISNVNKNSFNNPNSCFWSCNTGTGGNESFAQKWVNQVGGKTWAYEGKTSYEYIMYGESYLNANFFERNLDVRFTAISKFVDNQREECGFSKNGSLNYPKAGEGSKLIVFNNR